MSAMKKSVKEIIESSKSEEELLNNLNSFNHPLTNEELSFVSGGYCKCDECGTAAENFEDICGWHSAECGRGAQNLCYGTEFSMCVNNTEITCASHSRGICISPGW